MFELVPAEISFHDIIDFGCGVGGWLSAAKDMGAKSILGIEGEYIRQAHTVIPQEFIETHDLTTYNFDWKKKFDVALTIEVAEHLPETSADRFCRTLVDASDFIVFSAARVGQTGIGHINEQPLGYWVSKFWSLGYVPLEVFRPYLAHDKNVYPWLRMNLIMLSNYAMFLRTPSLHKFARPLCDFDRLF